MYRPTAFELADPLTVIDAYPLAQLIVHDGGDFHATPVPLLRRGEALVGHLARPNDVWRHPGDALAVFTAADAYITPRWYEAKAIDGKVVPTWNYTTVHVRGRLVVHDEPTWIGEVVALLTTRFEADFPEPWAVSDAPHEWIDSMVRGIVGIELVDLRIEGKAKLGQNRSVADQHNVIAGLSARTPREQAVADTMRASPTSQRRGHVERRTR